MRQHILNYPPQLREYLTVSKLKQLNFLNTGWSSVPQHKETVYGGLSVKLVRYSVDEILERVQFTQKELADIERLCVINVERKLNLWWLVVEYLNTITHMSERFNSNGLSTLSIAGSFALKLKGTYVNN